MIFQIRLAETGHSQKLEFDKSSKGERLISHISSSYSIAPQDQLLVTKIGHLIKSQEKLNRVMTQQRGDKTLDSKDYKQGLNISNERISCIYVFNLKELKKPIQKMQPKNDQYWKAQLKKNVECLSVLRPNVSIYSQSLKDIFSDSLIQTCPEIAKSIQQISKAFNTLEYSWGQLSEINNKIDQVIELCDNQKKCHSSLACLMGSMIEAISKKASSAMKLLQQLKGQDLIDDKSLRQNSGCFENRKKQEESVSNFELRLKQFKKKSEEKFNQMKAELKELKTRYRQYQRKSLDYANKNFKKYIIEQLKDERNKYADIIDMFKLFETHQDIKIIYSIQNEITLLQRLLQEKAEKSYYQIYQNLARYFKEFSEMNLQNKNYVKEGFQCFLKWKKIIDQYNNFVSAEEQAINSEIKQLPSKGSREPSFLSRNQQSQEASFVNPNADKEAEMLKLPLKNDEEVRRRVQFYKKVNFIQKYLDKICAEEEQQRKKYLKDNNLLKQKGKQLLKNYRVPTIEVEYEGTTDLELFKSNKLFSLVDIEATLTTQQFMISQYLKVQEKMANFLNKQNSTKIKNMQQLLKSMGEIFLKVYAKKEQQLNRSNDELNKKLKQSQIEINNLKETINNLDKKLSKSQLELKQKSELITVIQSSKIQELSREKLKVQKLVGDKKTLETNIKNQMKMTQELYNHINIQDQEMKALKQKYDDLNMMFGDREVYIIKLEKQLAQKQKNGLSQSSQIGNLTQNELKSVVLQGFVTKEERSIKLENQVTRLNQQIQILQSHIQQLEGENNYLSSQLRKLLENNTEDSESQTQQLPRMKQAEFQGITIEEEICLNQKAIFVPFNSNTYIGVHQKDEEKTICNMSNLYQKKNYVLDLKSFQQKTFNLLIQNSFVVVLKVTNIIKDTNVLRVRGEIEHLLGFQEDSITIKDYAPLLKN